MFRKVRTVREQDEAPWAPLMNLKWDINLTMHSIKAHICNTRQSFRCQRVNCTKCCMGKLFKYVYSVTNKIEMAGLALYEVHDFHSVLHDYIGGRRAN